MKNEPAPDNDQVLSRLLQAWRVEPSAEPGFQEEVWRRIGRQDQPRTPWSAIGWTRRARWFEEVVRQPVGAVAYLAALLAIGTGLGYWGAERAAVRTESGWRNAYVQAVSPYDLTPTRP